MATIELTPQHGWVLATLAGGYLVHGIYMGYKVGAARKKYGVPYPKLYADDSVKDANAYNCVQRGHQNSLENLSTFYALLLAAGVRYPVGASVAGAVYLLGRIFYFNGYASGDPKGRMRGGFGYFGLFGLLGMVLRWSGSLLMSA